MRGIAEGGGVESFTRAEWRELAVDEAPFPELAGTYLDHAWMIASASAVDASIRIPILSRVVRRAPDDESRATVVRWLAALQRGRKPKR